MKHRLMNPLMNVRLIAPALLSVVLAVPPLAAGDVLRGHRPGPSHQVGGAWRLAAGQRMAGTHGRADHVVHQRHGAQVGLGRQQPQQQVDAAFAQLAPHADVGAQQHLELDAALRKQLCADLRQHMRRRAQAAADAHMARRACREVAQLLLNLAGMLEQRPGALQQQQARGRQCHALGIALDQPLAHRRLEAADAFGDGRLAAAEHFGGAADVAQSRHRFEELEVAQVVVHE
nr:hypothetical protein [Pseudacidovorax sp. NFM-22]